MVSKTFSSFSFSIRNAFFRSLLVQVLVLSALAWGVTTVIGAVSKNLSDLRIPFGFDFLSSSAGFSVSQALIAYSEKSSYWDALFVGLINTCVVAILGICFATVLGFTVGIMRLSKNWLLSKIAAFYVETIRNIPLLLQIFVWYYLVLAPLPHPRNSLEIGLPYVDLGFVIVGAVVVCGAWLLRLCYRLTPSVHLRILCCFAYFASCVMIIRLCIDVGYSVIRFIPAGIMANNRGLFIPKPLYEGSLYLEGIAFIVAIVLSVGLFIWGRRRQNKTGRQFHSFWVSLALIFALPIGVHVIWGPPVSFDYPVLGGFNLRGGTSIIPEFVALFLALSFYTASFIAEIVRSGIEAVSHGQSEAASSLGLGRGLVLRKIIIPQAMRIVIPPLASQYMNLTKNSSLATAIGYPDLVAIGGVTLNQTGRAVEVIIIWMVVYLGLSLVTSLLMNIFNAKMKIVER